MTQPEALRLADDLAKYLGGNTATKASAELRRLHAELAESEKWRDRDEVRAANAEKERDIAEAQRDALLKALKEAVDVCGWPSAEFFYKALAAIKAVEGETK